MVAPIVVVRSSDFSPSPQPQPFPMQGSKRAQVPIINRLIPDGHPRVFEPFCGSGAASIGARCFGKVNDVFLSDANPALVNLWDDIIKDPVGLARRYDLIWSQQFAGHEVDLKSYFNSVRERHNANPVGDSAEFLYLLNRIVKASLRYGANGKFNQSADNRRAGARPGTVRQRVLETSLIMKGATTRHCDWMVALRDAEPGDIIYLDPPYQGTSDSRDQRYYCGLSIAEFESGVQNLVNRDLSVIISYDAIHGPIRYGRALSPELGLLPIDVITGVSAQSTLLGKIQEAHETIYLTPALVDRLGGISEVEYRLSIAQLPQIEELVAA